MRTGDLPSQSDALPGRQTTMPIPERHAVNGHPLGVLPAECQVAAFAMGCFWGAERLFWQQPGIYSTAVGYCGGLTPNPTYSEVCSGLTGHTETVLVVYHPDNINYDALLRLFWENHDPTQGMRQGNDIGTQYRSAIFTQNEEQLALALDSQRRFQQAMRLAGDPRMITTDILPATPFYYAEVEHQQYLAKNPHGYCGLKPSGVCLPPPPHQQTTKL